MKKFIRAIFIVLLISLRASAQDPGDILHYGPDSYFYGTIHGGSYAGYVGDATVVDILNNYHDSDLESILSEISGRISSISSVSGNFIRSDHVIMVTDTISIGDNYWEYIFPYYDSESSCYYDVRWKETPMIWAGYGIDFTPYAIQLPGATFGSDRGVRVNVFDAFSDATQIRLFGVLESVGGVNLYAFQNAQTESFGLTSKMLPTLKRMGSFVGRR